MGKIFRNIVVTVVLLALLLFVVPVMIPSGEIKRLIEESVAKSSDMNIQIGQLSMRLLPTPQLTMADILLSQSRGQVSILHAATGSASISLLPIFSGELMIDAIDFNTLEIYLPQRNNSASSTLNLERVTGVVDLHRDSARVNGLRVLLYGGQLNLEAELKIERDGLVSMSGRAQLHGIQVEPLLRDIHSRYQLSGTLSGEIDLSSRGATAQAMQQGLQADGPVRIRSGKVMINGISAGYDLIRFNLQTRGVNHHLNNIEAFSPLINATGDVQVIANYRLSGRLQAAGMGEALVGGTVDQPQLTPVAVSPPESAQIVPAY